MPKIYYSQWFHTFIILPLHGYAFIYSEGGKAIAKLDWEVVTPEFMANYYQPISFTDCPNDIKTLILRDFSEFNEELEDDPCANYKIS